MQGLQQMGGNLKTSIGKEAEGEGLITAMKTRCRGDEIQHLLGLGQRPHRFWRGRRFSRPRVWRAPGRPDHIAQHSTAFHNTKKVMLPSGIVWILLETVTQPCCGGKRVVEGDAA